MCRLKSRANSCTVSCHASPSDGIAAIPCTKLHSNNTCALFCHKTTVAHISGIRNAQGGNLFLGSSPKHQIVLHTQREMWCGYSKKCAEKDWWYCDIFENLIFKNTLSLTRYSRVTIWAWISTRIKYIPDFKANGFSSRFLSCHKILGQLQQCQHNKTNQTKTREKLCFGAKTEEDIWKTPTKKCAEKPGIQRETQGWMTYAAPVPGWLRRCWKCTSCRCPTAPGSGMRLAAPGTGSAQTPRACTPAYPCPGRWVSSPSWAPAQSATRKNNMLSPMLLHCVIIDCMHLSTFHLDFLNIALILSQFSPGVYVATSNDFFFCARPNVSVLRSWCSLARNIKCNQYEPSPRARWRQASDGHCGSGWSRGGSRRARRSPNMNWGTPRRNALLNTIIHCFRMRVKNKNV